MDIVSLELINLNVKFKIFNLQSKIIKKVLINKINKKKENQLKEIHALKDISFRLNAGDRLGIIGKNGSGKTTLLRTLAGIYNPSEGKVLTDGSIKSVLEVNSSGQLDDTVENYDENGRLIVERECNASELNEPSAEDRQKFVYDVNWNVVSPKQGYDENGNPINDGG